MERMHEVSTAGSSVWDPEAARSRIRDNTQDRSADDTLPPFAVLTNDDDRERKAETQEPGTFHVIVNPESFSDLPEYNDEDSSMAQSPTAPSASRTTSPERRSSINDVSLRSDTVGDPNTIILKKFEDPVRRLPSHLQSNPPQLSTSPASSSASIPQNMECLNVANEGVQGRSLFDVAKQNGHDAIYLDHYRNFIWPQIIQIPRHSSNNAYEGDGDLGEDAFEREAATFPPLYHAIMALSALSLAHREGVQSLDALQHYQQTLPSLQASLRGPRDLSSDGALFTHFFLLLYEIAAAEQWGANMWSQHLSQLLRITLMRHEMSGPERYPFITWWIWIIDTYAVLSGSGDGKIVNSILSNNLLPLAQEQLPSPGSNALNYVYPDEEALLPSILEFYQKITILATRLGQLALELRTEAAQRYFTDTPMAAPTEAMLTRQRRIRDIREAFQRALIAELPEYISADWLSTGCNLPPRVKGMFEHAYALSRACIIFSHTSMWPSQRFDSVPGADEEIAQSVSEILRIAEVNVNAESLGLRNFVFPLFMAGIATSSAGEKMFALDLMGTVEQHSVGRNTMVTRQLLQTVYDRQNESNMSVGHSFHIDWFEIITQRGLPVVNFVL
ncbi:MAG: hypothetical protein M1827_003007 [Pycnora praestabilis]|nr:MAG: hypothetical protein M1827_003007 [Pycnora praestabilis]